MVDELHDDGIPNASRQGKVVRGIVAAIATLVIAFCGWSMSEYVGGRDPLAGLLPHDALQTTAEAADDTASDQDDKATSKDAKAEKTSQAADKKSDKDADKAKKADKKKGDKESKTEQAKASAADDAPSRDATPSQGGVTHEVVETVAVEEAVPVDGSSPSQDPSPTQQAPVAQEAAPVAEPEVQEPARPQTILVTLSIDGGAGASSATIELYPGATAFDALVAAGVGVETIPNPFGSGTWVTSIGGLAEDAGHGWTYRVNGSMPNVMSDLYQLGDGDSVLWQYV